MESPVTQRGQHVLLRGQRDVRGLHDLVGEEVEPARGGDRRVELAHRACGGIARVGERLLAGREEARVERLELGPQHECLATDGDPAHGAAAGPRAGEAQRDGAEGAQVLGHVLAGLAIAAGGAAREQAALVHQLDREPVKLGLGDVHRVVALEPLAHPRIELAHLVGGHQRVEREQGLDVRHLLERRAQTAAHPQGGGVEPAQVRELRLERFQLAVERVVGGVGDARAVEHVVAVVVPGDLAHQLVDAPARLRRGHARLTVRPAARAGRAAPCSPASPRGARSARCPWCTAPGRT